MIGDILQPTHLLFILVIALIVLGPKRLPEVGKSLGRGLRDFRVALSGNEETEHLRESLREAQVNLQETHETLKQPVTMEPIDPQPSVPAQQPVATDTPAAEHAPANGEASEFPNGEAPKSADDPAPVEEPVERSG